MAQIEVGRPARHFADADLARFPVDHDALGRKAMRQNWPAIAALAEALLRTGRLSEGEAIALIAAAAGRGKGYCATKAHARSQPKIADGIELRLRHR